MTYILKSSSSTGVILDGNGGQAMIKNQTKKGYEHIPLPQHQRQDMSNIRRTHIIATGPGGWGTGSTIEEARAKMLKACGITPARAATKKYARVLSTVKYDISLYGSEAYEENFGSFPATSPLVPDN